MACSNQIELHIIRLGCFHNERDAGHTYDRAAILAFGECAHWNFPAHESEHVILPERVLRKIAALKNEVVHHV